MKAHQTLGPLTRVFVIPRYNREIRENSIEHGLMLDGIHQYLDLKLKNMYCSMKGSENSVLKTRRKKSNSNNILVLRNFIRIS